MPIPFLTIGQPGNTIQYENRTGVRCIITKGNDVCIIHIEKGNYYKLPGGGVEADDPNEIVAAEREALEVRDGYHTPLTSWADSDS